MPSFFDYEQKKQAEKILIGLFLLFGILVFRFFYLSVYEGEKWLKVASTQHQIVVSDLPKRGNFFSNTTILKGQKENAQPFVIDVLYYHLHVDSLSIPKNCHPEFVSKLKEILKDLITEEEIAKNLNANSHNRKFASWIPKEKIHLLMEWWKGYAKKNQIPSNALFAVKDYRRSYPFGKLLGQLLHTVRDEKDPLTLQPIPTGGLEMYFDHLLKGKIGKKLLLRSPRNSLETENILVQKEDGSDIYLTINHVIQAIAEEELEKGVKKVNAKGGVAVIMDPYNGHILALAQYPFFNPQEYRSFYNSPEKLEHTSIKAIAEAYEPGSTIKPITAAIALMANEELKAQKKPPLFNPEEMMPCLDGTFPGRVPLKDVSPHRYLNMYMAIQKSSNIYVARLAERIVQRLGAKWYREKLVEVFGFGTKTGIEMNYEHEGFVPSITKKYPNGQLQWSTPTPFSLAMGYNLLVNPIQLVRAYAIFANGGYLVQPTLIRKITKKSNGKETVLYKDDKKIADAKHVLKKEIITEIQKALKYVTKPGGGGSLADVQGFTEGGKSSTTEKLIEGIYSKKIHFSTFVGIVPMTAPRFVIMVGMDEPESKYIPGFGTTHFGGKCSAPVFSQIAKKALNYLGEKPDDPYGYPKSDPRSDLKKADWGMEMQELNELYKKWN
jgi:cell division protein FtsI (penicillin-binding protein 3)